jgi:hypothetical protein
MPAVTWHTECTVPLCKAQNRATHPIPSDPFGGGRGIYCGSNAFNHIWCVVDWPCTPPSALDEFGCGAHAGPPWWNVRFENLWEEPPVHTTVGAQICYELPVCTAGYCYCVLTGDCQPCACNPGTEDWDPWTCRCEPKCTPGNCWCAATRACVPCPPVTCAPYLNCHWDSNACQWACTRRATCPPHYLWSDPQCRCLTEPCPTGSCWCVNQGRCVDCDDPPCKVARGCVWNETTCQWDCTNPACGAGEHYDLKACRCVPDCSPGDCWCEGSLACVACPPPDCADELHCVWDPDACAWDCEDPADICPPGSTWTGAPDCRCDGAASPWNLETLFHGFHQVSTIAGLRYQGAPRTTPPFTRDVQVTTDPADGESSIIRDWRGRLVTLALNRGRVQERVSTDGGNTWSLPVTIAGSALMPVSHPRPAGPAVWNGAVVYAWYDAGALKGQIRYPGDVAPSAVFTFKDDVGADLAVDDDSFGLSPAPDAPRRWLLSVVVSGALTNLQSFDGCKSWAVI